MSFLCCLLKQIACQDVSATELIVARPYDGACPHQCGAANGTSGGLADSPSWWCNRDQCVIPKRGVTCYNTGVRCRYTSRESSFSILAIVLPASLPCSRDRAIVPGSVRCYAAPRIIASDRHNLPPHLHGSGIDARAVVVGNGLVVPRLPHHSRRSGHACTFLPLRDRFSSKQHDVRMRLWSISTRFVPPLS
jgi:hypothetical protein